MKRVTRYISIDDKSRKAIEAEVGCTYQLVYLALRNLRSGDKAAQVRQLAIAKGGENRVDAPQSHAIIKDESNDGSWELSLDNGVKVRFEFSMGRVAIMRDGVDIVVYPKAEMQTLDSIISYAANL